MPRSSRLDIPGLLQHVIVRGIEKRKIFLDDQDRALFVARLSALLKETGVRCYAWALIPNHIHLLLMPMRGTLSSFMRRLLTGYAVYFNRRQHRAGHLFQNRYKSIVCEEEPYLLELVRYIHLNPLRAGLVHDLANLDDYPWCGHSVLMGTRQMDTQEQQEILSRFGKSIKKARSGYRQYIADGVSAGRRNELVGGGLKRSLTQSNGVMEWGNFDERILGSGDFVDSLQQHELLREKIASPISLPELVNRVAVLFNLPAEAVQRHGKAKPVSEARGIVTYLAIRESGYKGTEVCKVLHLTSSGISIACRRGELLIREKPELQEIVLR
jgi:REP element-mobilizing transposase RayT